MKWVMAIIVVAFLLSTFFMYEGRSTRRSPSVNADGSMTDYEVAQINGRSLMRSELEQRTRNYLGTLGSRNLASLDMAAIYKTVLNQAVLESQLVKEIDEQGIRVSDAEAEQAMKTYADTYYPTRETFYQALANSGIKLEDYKRNLARQLAVDHLMSNAIGEIEISEDKAVEFYDSMKNLFYRQPEGFMVHMADFRTSEDAEAFRAKLVAGASWDVLASDDKFESADLVNITKQPVFLPSSAFTMGTLGVMASLDVSEPSPVFTPSSTDFAVGMKTSHVEEATRPYDEVSGDIKELLRQEEQRKRLADYEEVLKNKAVLVINDNELFTSPVVSEDKEPEQEIVIEKASEDVKEEAKSEDVKAIETVSTVSEEVKAEVKEDVKEEAKSGDIKPEGTPVKEEPKEEIKSEDVAPVAEVKEVKEEAKPEAEVKDEPKNEEAKPEVKAVEEVKVPEAEEVKEAKEELKEEVKEVKSEDSAPVVETVKEEVKAEVPAVEEVKEEVKAETEKTVSTLTESIDASIEIPIGKN